MKGFFLVSLLVVLPEAWALCLPDLGTISEKLNVNPELESTADRFLSTAQVLVPQDLHLTIRLDTLNPRVNAEIVKFENDITLTVMGGMLSRTELNENTFVLLLCHELGHLLGGDPKKSRGGWSSTEGQADYYSGYECAHRWGMSEEEFLVAAQGLTDIYSDVTGQARAGLEFHDPESVQRTNFGYPGIQCRLDTLLAGWRHLERPRCWFRP